ncbi:MAG: M48 family metallopeptidase [Clostridiales Family XIII bacterium]|jgi:predicted metal-dependent hydrolase|nr:M48 family metallopeptidase [Clostridiales Family XIII bacterium]
MIEYTLIRSRRRTLAIHIQDGEVTVRAPLRMPKREIDRIVASKALWIADRRARSQERAERRKAFALRYGDAVLFRGAEYPVTARAGARAGFDGERFYFPPDLAQEQIKALLVRVYRMLAKAHLHERVTHFAARMGTRPAGMRITAAKTRWGSCSAKKSINFSWRLVLADDAVIDYVVVHELAHLREMNHAARFWAIVEGVLPDYRERRARLGALQERLGAEDWG